MTDSRTVQEALAAAAVASRIRGCERPPLTPEALFAIDEGRPIEVFYDGAWVALAETYDRDPLDFPRLLTDERFEWRWVATTDAQVERAARAVYEDMNGGSTWNLLTEHSPVRDSLRRTARAALAAAAAGGAQ